MLIPGADPVRKISIIPRGRALGVTFQSPDADRYGYTDEYLRGRLAGMLGGRAAEEVVYGDLTTGAESDLEQATRIARQMVGRWGMSDADRAGLGAAGARTTSRRCFPGGNDGISERTRQIVDDEAAADHRGGPPHRARDADRAPRAARGARPGAARARDARRDRRLPDRRHRPRPRARPHGLRMARAAILPQLDRRGARRWRPASLIRGRVDGIAGAGAAAAGGGIAGGRRAGADRRRQPAADGSFELSCRGHPADLHGPELQHLLPAAVRPRQAEPPRPDGRCGRVGPARARLARGARPAPRPHDRPLRRAPLPPRAGARRRAGRGPDPGPGAPRSRRSAAGGHRDGRGARRCGGSTAARST